MTENIKIEISIKGMSCEECASSIAKALKKEDGVLNAEVNFADKNTYIEYDPGKTNLKKLHSLIEVMGYEILEKV